MFGYGVAAIIIANYSWEWVFYLFGMLGFFWIIFWNKNVTSFPENNNPKTGSFKTELDKLCQSDFFGGNTTLYKIEKVFKSRGSALVLRFYDELYQPNAIDKNGENQEKCDESWSLDNLTVRAINYK